MKKVPGLALTLALTVALVGGLLATKGAPFFASVADDCNGKPYGTQGCPVLGGSSTSTPASCGNGKVDAEEECDNGDNNGKAGNVCSALCRLRYCGDGVVNQDLNEECEPQAEQFYAKTGSGDELMIERRFTAPKCGNYCTPPQCDANGICAGGCKLQFLPACQASSGTGSAASQQKSSTAASSLAASSSVATSSVKALSSSSSARPGISITMEGPLAVQTGQNSVFRITLRNFTTSPVQNIVVTDYLLNYGGYGGFNLEAATGGAQCRLTGVTVRCSGIDMNASETKSIQLSFVFLPSPTCVQRSVQAYATVSASAIDPDASDNETEPVWTTVRCPGGFAQSSSSSVVSSAVSGSGSVASTGSIVSSSSIASSSAPTNNSSSVAPAVCGNGTQEPPEECDAGTANGQTGSVCDVTCKRILPAAPETTFDRLRPILLTSSIGIFALLMALFAFIKRKAIIGIFRKQKSGDEFVAAPAPESSPTKTLDDVPLDEIEMPWRKF